MGNGAACGDGPTGRGLAGLKARHVIARPEGPGRMAATNPSPVGAIRTGSNRWTICARGRGDALTGLGEIGGAHTRPFRPGYNRTGLQPEHDRRAYSPETGKVRTGNGALHSKALPGSVGTKKQGTKDQVTAPVKGARPPTTPTETRSQRSDRRERRRRGRTRAGAEASR